MDRTISMRGLGLDAGEEELPYPNVNAEPRSPAASRSHWVDRVLLGVLYLATLAALTGYVVFTLNPALLNHHPLAPVVYGQAFTVAAQGQIILAFVVLAALLFRVAGVRWLSAFVLTYVISLGSELAGTTVGLPFGPYRYTDALGIKWLDHVPVLIPISWFFMAVPSYALALRSRFATTPARQVMLASLILLSWDLILDPAMSGATSYWVWGTEGVYYGMPMLNLFGWYVTGLALMAALHLVRAAEWARTLPAGWMAAFFVANPLLPWGMSAVAGMWGAVAASLLALGVCWWLVESRAPARQG